VQTKNLSPCFKIIQSSFHIADDDRMGNICRKQRDGTDERWKSSFYRSRSATF